MNKVNVLIVDDNEVDRYILKRQLEKIGVNSIMEKSDGCEALEFLRDYDQNAKLFPDEFPPVIIFLDINMPKVNGFDFLKEFALMRSKNELSSIVVCMYSSSERPEDKERVSQYDFVESFIVKGSINHKFMEKIIQALR